MQQEHNTMNYTEWEPLLKWGAHVEIRAYCDGDIAEPQTKVWLDGSIHSHGREVGRMNPAQ
jgi:hypothetical protein